MRVLLVAALLAQTAATEAEPEAPTERLQRLGIFDIQVIGIKPGLKQTAVDALATAIGATGRYVVVTGTELRALLDNEARKQLPIRDEVVTLYIELEPGTYYAEAFYTEQRQGSNGVLSLLRQYTLERFDVAAESTSTVDLFENETIEFDYDGDGITNLAEIEATTDPEDPLSFDCAASPCKPVTVTTAVPSPEAMTADSTNVYILVSPTDGVGGSIFQVDKQTGEGSTLVTTGREPYRIAVASDRLIWADRGPTGPLPPTDRIGWIGATGSSDPVVVDLESVVDFYPVGEMVYYAHLGSSQTAILGIQLPSGTPLAAPLLDPLFGSPRAFIADADNVAFVMSIPCGTELVATPTTGSASSPTTLTSVGFLSHTLRQDATHLYWVDDTSIRRIDKSGGTATTVHTDDQAAQMLDLHLADGVIYWVRLPVGSNAHDLMALPVVDEPALRIIEDPSGDLRIGTADASRFYWVTEDGTLQSIGKLRGI